MKIIGTDQHYIVENGILTNKVVHFSRLFFVVMMLMVLLTACGGIIPISAGGGSEKAAELPRIAQLLVGILKLEGTNHAVTQSQAKELLFLWKAYQRLSKEETTAAEELKGLQEQIQEQLDQEQVNAINSMNLSFKDVAEVLEKEGVARNSKRENSGSSSSVGPGMPPPDVMVMGAPGGAGMGLDRGLRSGSSTTGQGGVTRNMNGMVDSRLFEVIVDYLKKKAGVDSGQ